MAKSKYRDDPPHQHREVNQSGLLTNACQQMPNGMEFNKPEVEQYFTQMQERHWRDEDGPDSLPAPWNPGDYEMRERVESSRFLNRPVTGSQGPKPIQDTEE